jgi:hypothetical protein
MRRPLLLLGLVAALVALVAPAIAEGATGPTKLDAFLYVDTVNGTRPAGARPRPIGCTQSNTFTRGEQMVFRVWGTDAATGEILSTENVEEAYVTFPGMANLKLNWGAHGPTSNRVWFWTVALNIPADFALGAGTATVVFKTDEGKFGRSEYQFTIVPALRTAAKTKTASKAKVKLAARATKA